jgi:hypothetical protein
MEAIHPSAWKGLSPKFACIGFSEVAPYSPLSLPWARTLQRGHGSPYRIREGDTQRMVSPEALKLNEILRNAPKAVDMDLAHQRAAGEHAEDMTFPGE